MKKTLFAILSALLVVCCFFGCVMVDVDGSGSSGSGDVNFSSKTSTVSVAYPVSDVTSTDEEVIVVSANADGSELTFTSKKPGNASVIIYSYSTAKKATVSVVVSSAGYVVIEGDSSENSQILNTMTYNGQALTHKKSFWVDDPQTLSYIPVPGVPAVEIKSGYYNDADGVDPAYWYMLLNGDVAYLMVQSITSGNECYWKFARGVVEINDSNISFDWTSYGDLTQNISGKYFTAWNEHKDATNLDVDVDFLNREDLSYVYSDAEHSESLQLIGGGSEDTFFLMYDTDWNTSWRTF